MCCPVAVLVSAVDVVCIFLLREVAGSEAAEEAEAEGTARGGNVGTVERCCTKFLGLQTRFNQGRWVSDGTDTKKQGRTDGVEFSLVDVIPIDVFESC